MTFDQHRFDEVAIWMLTGIATGLEDPLRSHLHLSFLKCLAVLALQLLGQFLTKLRRTILLVATALSISERDDAPAALRVVA
jgi:hypothetical protein